LKRPDSCNPIRAKLLKAEVTDWNNLIIEFDTEVMIKGFLTQDDLEVVAWL
jgi:hypothetical protein